ncbi:sugar-transfer associated ATP-grasp domain-containing protein [Aquimarina sp. 2201CG5-10]|uniref:sugar-transfer associated ATP-grasp domain-containing protein n=1 Tax=Aquimarina callyspongiae TaxID=3098150 RepID=UPI002AB4A0BB|nr:sugar-transfer associated ATP-grasp domain-containing protein [Aquimarina sp. 2201CG5-10]MDY8136287.1 sugar-transfer associated ATP-grasp domain-containing protein [Aquimarina sp. 2201CG5-10]
MKRKLFLLQKRINVVLKDKNKKKFLQILKEAIIFWIVKKEFPNFYFGKFLYREDITNYKDYLSSKEIDKVTLSKNLHHFQYTSLLRNKLAFAYYMEHNSLPVPSLVSHNLENRFFFKTKVFSVYNKLDLVAFFETVFKETKRENLFVKEIDEMCGNGCYLITKQTLKEDMDRYGDMILKSDFIHQERVIQHPHINSMYAHSLNTIRFDTYVDVENEVHILAAFMRFGRGGSVVDNTSQGGFFVPVDVEKGKLKGKSLLQMKYGGEQLTEHPDTNTVFDNFEIPFYQESLELVKKAVTFIPDRIIGWDIAISENGPVVIEGNDNNSFVTSDMAYGGYLKHPIFKEIIEEAY